MKGKGAKSLSAGSFKAAGGPSGKMHKMTNVGAQKPGVSDPAAKGGSGKFPTGGPSGKMQKMKGTTAQKPGRSSVR